MWNIWQLKRIRLGQLQILYLHNLKLLTNTIMLPHFQHKGCWKMLLNKLQILGQNKIKLIVLSTSKLELVALGHTAAGFTFILTNPAHYL
nr:hypothetical protein Iba_chr08dCG4850 [Ipomoea batatas]